MINQANFLQSLGWAVLSSLWQLALLWLLYQLVTASFKSARPAAKSMLATSLLIAGFAWFLYTFFMVLGSGDGISLIGGYGNEEVNNWLGRTLPAASLIYLSLLFIPLFRFIRNYRYVQVIRQFGLTRPDPEWRLFVNRVAGQMGIRKPVHIWISEWVTSPVTIGYLKPVILVPMAALNQLSIPQMEAVLLHELSHIRRYDYLLNLVLNLIRTILYFNPFARAFVKIVEAEREKSCDEMVLQFQYDSHEYASALLTLEKVSREQHILVLSAAAHGKELLGRIQHIVGVQQKRKVSLRQFTAVLSALFMILSINAFFILGRSIRYTARSSDQQLLSAPLADINLSRDPVSYTEHKQAGYASNKPGLPGMAAGQNSMIIPAAAGLAANPAIVNASFDLPQPPDAAPELDKEEEAVVRDAVASSRKVLENSQWSAIEKNLADVFSREEKEEMKKALSKEMSHFDWAQWENKLRMAYDKVNWEQVNYQLNTAITNMKRDSLVKVYNEALYSLNMAKKEMTELAIAGLPDSDVSLKSLAEKQRQLQKELSRLKATRIKKIVHL